MKHTLFIIACIFLVGLHSSRAQSAESDSLENRLLLVEANEKIPILIELIELNQRNAEKATGYADEARQLLDIYPDPVQESLLLGRTGWVYYYEDQLETAMELSIEADQLAMEIPHPANSARAKILRGRVLRQNDDYDGALAVLDSALVMIGNTDDPLLRASILNESGTIYRRKGELQKALDVHSQALELVEPSGNKKALSVSYNLLGITSDMLGNYDDALRFYLQSLEVREELNDQRGMAAGLTNLGILHQRLEQYPEALDFYERSLAIWRELDAQHPLASTLNNMGAVYELTEQYETARQFYEDAHEIWSETGNLYSISISLNNLGTIHQYLGDLEKALEFKQQVLQNHIELENIAGTSSVLRDISLIYMDIEQPDSAMTAAHQSLEYALESGSWQQIRNAHELLSGLYETSGDYARALEHYKLFQAANDTLFNADSQTIIAEMQEQYRTRRQQQEIELLQREREMRTLWFLLVIGGLTTAFIIIGFMYNRYKLKVKNREKLHLAEIEKTQLAAETAEAKTKLLDAENRRKSKELEDARNLQLSMLPAALPECSHAEINAFMHTAAEVGGDYYDADLLEDGTLTLCVGDATGHGTKAGLLVMAMKSLFSLMSSERDLKSILQRSSLAIKKMNLPQLYMAFALARLKGNTLELVGAGMPPALVYRADTGDVETVDLKGMPLGSVPNYPYETQKLEMYRNDVLLLLSDGYPELLRNDGEMLGYGSARKILSETGHLSPTEIIQRFRDTANEWLREERPNDDITFLVVKKR